MVFSYWVKLLLWSLLLLALVIYSVSTFRLTKKMLVNWWRIRIANKAKLKLFPANHAPDILNGKYTGKYVGGGIALSKMDVVTIEIDKLFTCITEKDALVNAVLNNKIDVLDLKLDRLDVNSERMQISMSLHNKTRRRIVCKIPKGQVF
ncbi:MAG: hypothetical protein L0226_11170, partial [Acidobacteria bacterium]|nr:hypothetical protein [Acidobacteriota bacterium]